MTLSYEENLRLGKEYEQFVTEKLQAVLGWTLTRFHTKWTQLRGENKEGIEIKYDRLMQKFKRIYIEVAEKTNSSNTKFAPSGIMRDDNSKMLVIGDYDKAYIFDIIDLRLMYKKRPKWLYYPQPTKTSMGFCIPLSQARKLAAYVVDFRANNFMYKEPEKRLRL